MEPSNKLSVRSQTCQSQMSVAKVSIGFSGGDLAIWLSDVSLGLPSLQKWPQSHKQGDLDRGCGLGFVVWAPGGRNRLRRLWRNRILTTVLSGWFWPQVWHGLTGMVITFYFNQMPNVPKVRSSLVKNHCSTGFSSTIWFLDSIANMYFHPELQMKF